MWLIKCRKNNDLNNNLNTNDNELDELTPNKPSLEINQQTFTFDNTIKLKKLPIKNENFKNFKLPSLDFLEKNPSKINLLDLSKNRPEGSFIEKILN